MVFEFLEEFHDETREQDQDYEWRSEGGEEDEIDMAEALAFWGSKHQQLFETLLQRTSTEMKIQNNTEEIMNKLKFKGTVYKCFKERVVEELRDLGYNSAVCKSKWRDSIDIPAGEHSYIDIIMESKNKKKSPYRIIIELNFKEEFEMVRGCEEYNKLVIKLPEIFVGKADKLKSVVKIMCSAGKRCLKGNKMHMAPWRKYKYMQSKWLANSERVVSSFPKADRRFRPRSSMLTFDLQCSALEVV